jgi:ParB family chromosome partitioning protein
VKAQEVKRLQEAVQEKSKQLKVVELELARYKNKPAVATSSPSRLIPTTTVTNTAAPARPAVPATHGPAVGDEDEPSTNINAIPPSVPRTAAAPRPITKPMGMTPAAPQRTAPPKEERTLVSPSGATLPPPVKGENEDDFTSIIDELGD